jgi:hypothetical protein
VRTDKAGAADSDPLANDGAGRDDCATPDLRPRPDDGAGLDPDILLQARIGVDRSLQRVVRHPEHAGWPQSRRISRRQIGAVSAIRIRRFQNRDPIRHPVTVAGLA